MIHTLIVTGPTASGKTRLAVALTQRYNGEIISADSRQVFRGMDLGTGKDLNDYHGVPYHLIDIVEPNEPYHLFRFLADAYTAISEIAARGKRPIVCGGTPLWIHGLLKGYTLPDGAPDLEERVRLNARPKAELQHMLRSEHPDVAAQFKDWENPMRLVHAIETGRLNALHGPNKLLRPEMKLLTLAPYYHRTVIRARIESRLDERLRAGLVNEVKHLHACGVSYERLEFFGLEYRAVARFLQGQITEKEMRDLLLIQIHKFAKRQDIWFRKIEREIPPIYWLEAGDIHAAEACVEPFLADAPLPPVTFELNQCRYGKKDA